MYGYNDYNGPLTNVDKNSSGDDLPDDDDVDDDDNPLRVGQWMEGDSLAPPCGTSIPTIHALLEFASVSETDVLYDLGCGDGRVCLEALVHGRAQYCVGVEVEQDLMERFQHLIGELSESFIKDHNGASKIRAVHADLRDVLNHLVAQAESNDGTADVDKRFMGLPMPTVLVLYLLPESVRELEPDLLKLINRVDNFRIICNTWGLETVDPIKVLEVKEPDSAASTVFRMYSRN
ncbi:Mycolic acid cyclopropane synthetase [Fragilaria crotonensis]|nr:Mycolic acid cyclopropane synthetase [Fragilaria crotonensis]